MNCGIRFVITAARWEMDSRINDAVYRSLADAYEIPHHE